MPVTIPPSECDDFRPHAPHTWSYRLHDNRECSGKGTTAIVESRLPYSATVTGESQSVELPPRFLTAEEAWDYLLDRRRDFEDGLIEIALFPSQTGYSEIKNTLEELARGNFDPSFGVDEIDGTGTLIGVNPGGRRQFRYTVTRSDS